MNQSKDEKAKDHVVVAVTLATDWFHKERLVYKFPNRNTLDCQLHDRGNHPVLFTSVFPVPTIGTVLQTQIKLVARIDDI